MAECEYVRGLSYILMSGRNEGGSVFQKSHFLGLLWLQLMTLQYVCVCECVWAPSNRRRIVVDLQEAKPAPFYAAAAAAAQGQG